MIKRVLVPIDFSEPSKAALKYAMEFGQFSGLDEIHLLHSIYIPVNPSDSLVSVSKIMIEDGEKLFEDLKNEISTWPQSKGFKILSKVMVEDVVSAIKSYSKNVELSYVIMGTKGATGLEEFLFGTTAADVLEQSDVPVIIVPPYTIFHKPSHIVFASDLKDIANMQVLAPLKNLAIACESKVVILHVSRDVNMTEVEVKEKEDLKNYFHGLELHFQVIHSENIYAGIEMYMQDQVPDMVAVLSRKHGFLESIFRESISKKLAHRTIIPMLSIRTTG